MSARRERPPTGRVNTRDLSATSLPSVRNNASRSGFNTTNNFQRSNNQTEIHFGSSSNPPNSDRSTKSDLSRGELLNRIQMRETRSFAPEQQKDFGHFNSFSRPKTSSAVPLRTVFLDPEANNFPRSKTRTELLRRFKSSGTPHPSFDLDKDGYVSQQDYKLAKRFDLDNNGIIDKDELVVAKKILAEEFFTRNASEIHNFGDIISNQDRQKSVAQLANSEGFERAYIKLSEIERTINSTKPLLGAIRPGLNREIIKHNFYTNKFDTTAWNDSDAIPRHLSDFDVTNHGGSRKRLLFTRSEQTRNELQNKMATMTFKTKPVLANVRRYNLITDIKYENGKY